MFKDYQATKKDFEAIEEGIRTAWRKEMNFVFKKKSYIKNVAPISFDSQFFYIWSSSKIPKFKSTPSHFANYQVYQSPHKLKINEHDQMGWCANAEKWRSFLPKSLNKHPKAIYISGGLLTPFTKIHKRFLSRGHLDIYNTYEGYLGTLVHEFGHIYYNSQPISNLNKKANLKYLKTAADLFIGRKIKKFPRIKLYRSFAFEAWTEVFAFCTEYYAASLFWPKFKKNLDKYWKANLAIFIKKPSLLTSRTSHYLAAAIGKILMSGYPQNWPEKILQF